MKTKVHHFLPVLLLSSLALLPGTILPVRADSSLPQQTVAIKAGVATTISSIQSDRNYAKDNTIKVESVPSSSTNPSSTSLALLKFDLASIPAGATISKASLKLWGLNASLSDAVVIQVNQITQDWTDSITWNTNSDIQSHLKKLLGKSLNPNENNSFPTAITIDDSMTTDGMLLTDLVKDWYSQKQPNQGLLLAIGSTTNADSLAFAGAPTNIQDTSLAPTLVINFDPPLKLNADIKTTNITGSGATISWTSNKSANSYISYGVSTAYGQTKGLDPLVTSHSVTLDNLQPKTTYHFVVKSTDATEFSQTSADQTFETPTQTATAAGTEPANTTAAPGSEGATTSQTGTEQATTAANQPQAPATKTKTAATQTATNNTASGKGDLALGDNAQYAPQPNGLDKTKDFLSKLLPIAGILIAVIFIIRLTIGNYLGAPTDDAETALPPEEPLLTTAPYPPQPNGPEPWQQTQPLYLEPLPYYVPPQTSEYPSPQPWVPWNGYAPMPEASVTSTVPTAVTQNYHPANPYVVPYATPESPNQASALASRPYSQPPQPMTTPVVGTPQNNLAMRPTRPAGHVLDLKKKT